MARSFLLHDLAKPLRRPVSVQSAVAVVDITRSKTDRDDTKDPVVYCLGVLVAHCCRANEAKRPVPCTSDLSLPEALLS